MSIPIISERHKVHNTIKCIDFYKNGELCAGFDLDKNDNPIFKSPEAIDNYQSLITNGDFVSKINTYDTSYVENAKAKCKCGETIELFDEYLGACECPNCHKWYNLFGQELTNPKTWSMNEDW